MAAISEKFHVENDVIITTKDKISVEEVSNYLIQNANNFRLGSQFIVVCGVHGYKNGELGEFDYDLLDDYNSMFERFHRAPKFSHMTEIIKEREFQMGTVLPVFSILREGKYFLYENSKMTIKIEFEKIMSLKRPIVLILASCWSFKSEISNILRSSGLYSALNIIEERGKITVGKLFKLDNEQQDLLKNITDDLITKDNIIMGK